MWSWILFLGVVSLSLLIALRAVKGRVQEYRQGGLLWCANKMSCWGPCCEACLIEYTLRPTCRSPEGVQYYELTCPLCHTPLASRAFTLQALLEAREQLAIDLRHRPAGLTLGAVLSPPTHAPKRQT
ncbi:MAG: hypothetical protein ACE5HL_05345 [Terriglobia bacterium]